MFSWWRGFVGGVKLLGCQELGVGALSARPQGFIVWWGGFRGYVVEEKAAINCVKVVSLIELVVKSVFVGAAIGLIIGRVCSCMRDGFIYLSVCGCF